MSYNQIKALAKEHKLSVKDLLVLHPKNDPFYTGSKSEIAMANWIAEQYQKWSQAVGKYEFHPRRLHYYIQALKTVVRHNGTPYVNTDACWNYIVQAVKVGRYLGTIPMDAVIDRKNETHKYARYWKHGTVEKEISGISIETIAENISSEFRLFNQQLVQPYHLEIWIEKGMPDIINPIANQYGIDLVVGEGELSLAQVDLLMRKAFTYQKPVRVFYICDFDPKGIDMPVSIARKIEWFTRKFEKLGKLDVKLHHLMLTHEQCIEHELPRTPIKAGEGEGTGARAYDTLSRRFQDKFGQGATELNALEAIHPGEMERIIEEAIKQYYDPNVAEVIRAQNNLMQQAVKEAILESELLFKDALDEVDFAPVTKLFDDFEFPEAEADGGDEENWLFDSSRNYTDQLTRFKKFKAGDG